MPRPPSKTKKAAAKKVELPKNGATKKSSPKKKNGSPESSAPRLRESPLPVDQSAHKFVLQPFTPSAPEPELPAYEYLGELPESYGTRRIFLTARDPRWLYAYWDFSWQQLRDAEQESPEGKVFLQIYIPGAERVHQIQVFPGSKEWYLPVHRPATLFQAELGYYRHDGTFHRLAVSDEVLTPRDDPSPNREVEFVTIPFHYSFRQLLDLIRDQILPGEGLAKALARLQREGFPLPFPYALRRAFPSGLADRILEYLGGDLVRRIRVGSLEITETLRRRLLEMGSSGIPSSLS